MRGYLKKLKDTPEFMTKYLTLNMFLRYWYLRAIFYNIFVLYIYNQGPEVLDLNSGVIKGCWCKSDQWGPLTTLQVHTPPPKKYM